MNPSVQEGGGTPVIADGDKRPAQAVHGVRQLCTFRRPFFVPSWLALLFVGFSLHQAAQFAVNGWNYSELARAAGSRHPNALAAVAYPIAGAYLLLAIALFLEFAWARWLLRGVLTYRLLFYLAPHAWQETAYGAPSVWRLVIGSATYVLLACAGAWLLRFRAEMGGAWTGWARPASLPRTRYDGGAWKRLTRFRSESAGEWGIVTDQTGRTLLRCPIPAAKCLELWGQFVRVGRPVRFLPARVRLAWEQPLQFRLVPHSSFSVDFGEKIGLAVASGAGEFARVGLTWPLAAASAQVLEIRSATDALCGYVLEFEACQQTRATPAKFSQLPGTARASRPPRPSA